MLDTDSHCPRSLFWRVLEMNTRTWTYIGYQDIFSPQSICHYEVIGPCVQLERQNLGDYGQLLGSSTLKARRICSPSREYSPSRHQTNGSRVCGVVCSRKMRRRDCGWLKVLVKRKHWLKVIVTWAILKGRATVH